MGSCFSYREESSGGLGGFLNFENLLNGKEAV
jgi:hypothetical protein